MSTFKGHTPRVGVQRPAEIDPIEFKARSILLGRQITGVTLEGGQLLLELHDGGTFSMTCEGGFLEAN